MRCTECGHLFEDHVMQSPGVYACEVLHGDDRCGCTHYRPPHVPRRQR